MRIVRLELYGTFGIDPYSVFFSYKYLILSGSSSLISPATAMRIVRLDMLTPEHRIAPATYGPWFWTIEYAPVVFDNQPFWMPATITSKAATESRSVEWDFTATYSRYHKLTVHSTILPNIDETPK